MKLNHIELMKQALALAKTRRGFCAPNPAVGAVITRENKIIATGAHFGAGHPHAEIEALKSLQNKAENATLYVTLEPCCHFGKTPPCTDQIIQSGIREVYFGLLDPNPIVAGKGVKELENAGIRCELINLPEIQEFYRSYIYWTQHRRPWVTIKIAMSLDGKIAGPAGARITLTGPELQRVTHEYRLHSDAILSTINTIVKDDPQFNVRLENNIISKPIYILDSQLRLPREAKILKTAKTLTIFHADTADVHRRQTLINAGIRCEIVPVVGNGLDLQQVLTIIGRDGIHDLWVEAGGTCFQNFLHEKLFHRALIYIAPKILGENATAGFNEPFSFPVNAQIKWYSVGSDCVCEIEFA